jgi:hypothetical protein
VERIKPLGPGHCQNKGLHEGFKDPPEISFNNKQILQGVNTTIVKRIPKS